MKASEIAALVGGRFEGTNDPEITGVAAIDRAQPHELSFVAAARYAAYLPQARAGALLVTDELAERAAGMTRIIVGDVHRAVAQVLAHFHPQTRPAPGIHPTAIIAPDAQLGADVIIEPYAVIGARTRVGDRAWIGAHSVIGDDCVLGDDVRCFPRVTLYSHVKLGARCVVHSGAVLGSDGFGYTFVDGRYEKVPQVGGVVIGDDDEIGANATVDRGSVGPTEIGNGVKIDNMVHLGHNVRVGDLTVMAAQTGVAGSTTIGKGVVVGGQVGIPGHIQIGDRATLAAKTGVFGDIPPGETWGGYPAVPHREFLKAQAALLKLHDLLKRVRKLEQQQPGTKE